MSFLAIDLGASFIKGAVLDLESMTLRQVRRLPFPGFLADLPSSRREVDPGAILTAVGRLVHDLLSVAPDCTGMVMCSQMHGVILTDPQGKPLSNFISWQDQRIDQPHPSAQGTYFDVLSRHIAPLERQQLGNELRPGLAICSLFWMEEAQQLPSKAVPASLPDFILANLCGAQPGMERTMAAAHGVLNLETLDWHYPVIEELGLANLHWPAVRSPGEIVGVLNADHGPVTCYTPVGDQQCALVGACLEPGELSLNVATGSQVSLLCTHREYGNYQIRPFFEGQFLKTITHIPAGRSLNALVKLLTELAQGCGIELADPWVDIRHATERIKETDLRVNLAFFPGACGDRGGISNIGEDNLTIGHLFRAAFESMAGNYLACALRLSPERSWRSLVFSGGLVQKLAVLREIIAEKFQIGYRVSPSSEDTLLGLLALALVFVDRGETPLRQVMGAIQRVHSPYVPGNQQHHL